MSSEVKNRAYGKVKSMTSKLVRKWVWMKVGIYLMGDLFWGLIISILWLWEAMYARGKDILDVRELNLEGGFKNLTLVVWGSGDQLLLRESLIYPLVLFFLIFCVVLMCQFMNVIFSIHGQRRKVRKILDPINEMALQAEEISRTSFDEDKYQQIEDAITRVNPEDTKLKSLHDKDLAGIEAAMNNLLQRLHESNQRQARFVNDASHELRTPIAVIQGYANMLDRWGKDDEGVLEESITAIKNESDHMNHLVEQLLFLARGDSGRNVMERKEVSLNQLLKEVWEESQMIDETHPYKWEDPSEEIHIICDASMMKQAMRILTDNAAKYTKEGDEILFSLGSLNEKECYLQVQDSGMGMADADVQHMFDRFYRGDEARNTKGTGLGLSIAKWIVDKHHGYFDILSRTELGTRIRIILPKN